jgi:hypothetical protein
MKYTQGLHTSRAHAHALVSVSKSFDTRKYKAKRRSMYVATEGVQKVNISKFPAKKRNVGHYKGKLEIAWVNT